jgi:Trk K+ transport system NAD-binding subunit
MSEVWTVVQTLLSDGKGIEATRVRGLQVMRARVREGSRLSGLMLSEVTDFRDRYKAAVLAIQKVDGQVHTESVSTIMLDVGDVLVLQVAEDSPLLESPPQDCQVQESKRLSISLFRRMSQTKHSDEEISQSPMSDVEDAGVSKETLAAWSDLEATKSQTDGGGVKREFLTAMAIGDGSGLAGRTVAQSGIDKLPGTFLVSIERPHVVPESHPPVDSFKTIPFTEALEAGDVLWFSGAASDVGDLRKIPGLILYDSGEVNKMNEKAQNRRLVEAVVSRNGSLVGRTAKDVKFRANYGAAVISVSREGKRVHELPGNIKFHAGDVLLLEAGKTFMDANKNNQCDAFTLISVVQDSSPPRFRMLFPAVFLTVAAYVCYMVKWPVPTLFGTAMVAAILMVMLGVLSEAEARAAIRWEIYLTIAPAFGVGQALINSGVAETMANFFVSVSDKMNIGDAGLLGAIYFATVLMSQVVANNAAAALIFPIAMDAAEKVGIDLEIMSFAIMLAASAAFMTPFGYQTNLMVMGPGGYSTGDFLILGTPMQLVLTVVTTISLVTPTRWYLVWLVSLAVLICVSLFRYLSERKRGLGKRY